MMMVVRCVTLRNAVLTALALATAQAHSQPLVSPPAATNVAPSDVVLPDQSLIDLMTPMPGIDIEWPALNTTSAESDAATPEAETRYTVEVTGLDSVGLQARFRELSQLQKGRNDSSNTAQIRRRTVDDVQLIDLLLRSVGHYAGTIEPLITPPLKNGAATIISIVVDPGPLFRIDKINIQAPTQLARAIAQDALQLTPGTALISANVDAAEDGMRARLAKAGYPFPEIGPPEIVVDHALAMASMTQTIDPGPQARFGAIRSEGKAIVSSQHLQRMVRYRLGDIYNADELEDIRRALIATNLYGAVTVRPVRAGTNADGTAVVDVVVAGEGAPLRTISGTAGYSTGEGARLTASWQNRNFFPPQGAVTFSGVAAQREQAVGAEFRRRNWLQRDRTLVISTNFSAQQQDAFRATTATVSGSVERETNLIWQKKWYYSLGTEFTASNEADLSAQSTTTSAPRILYYIIAAPMSLSYDGSDDLLNPVRGFRLNARASPEVSFQTGTFAYMKTQIEGSYYLPVSKSISLAGRLHLGTIFGASRGDIAPTRRFYAGGGGSVRGFGYQQVGPQDSSGTPTGGNSLTEASIEARIRFGDWGVVPFIDAGQVFSKTVPSFSSLQAGAGIGLRYYTAFGPVRIDVATPINPRAGDPRIAFYVSIGQAF